MSRPGAGRSLRHALGLLAVIAVLGVTATSAEAHRSAGTTAIVRFAGDYTVLDFQQSARQGPVTYSFPTYDRLLAFDSTGSKVVPDIVTSYAGTPVNRPKVWTFHMKHGVMCQDGHELSPVDVLNSYERFFTVQKISNSLPAFFGNGPYELHANMKAWTFTFKTLTPFANAPYGFAQTGIICPAGLAALKTDPNALNTQTYGSGPYTLVSAAHNDQVVYQKNPKWRWGPAGTDISKMPDTLIYKIIPDQTTAANVLLTGGTNISPISGPDVYRLLSNGSLQKKTAPNYYPMPLVFNQSASRITSDDKVRAAVMAAVIPSDFIKASGWGYGANPNISYLNPNEKCHMTNKALSQYAPTGGPAKAQQIMQSDGYTLSNGVLTKNGQAAKITLVTSPDFMGGGGPYLANQLKQAGFDVNLQDLSVVPYAGLVVPGNFDAAVEFSYQYFPAPWYNLALNYGPGPPKGGNLGNIGGTDQDYIKASQFAQQRTDCYWSNQLQQLMLTHHVMLPLGEQVTYVFGDQHWNFPNGVPSMEPEWITSTGK
jgi:peptide/nickel transport system substrate-binding protein